MSPLFSLHCLGRVVLVLKGRDESNGGARASVSGRGSVKVSAVATGSDSGNGSANDSGSDRFQSQYWQLQLQQQWL